VNLTKFNTYAHSNRQHGLVYFMKHFTWTFYIRTCMGEWFCRICPGDAGKRVL